MVGAWEEQFALSWDSTYGPAGNPLPTGAGALSDPVDSEETLVSGAKRLFDDTPSKAKQDASKKSREDEVSDPEDSEETSISDAKRQFDDTPSKAKQDASKKSRQDNGKKSSEQDPFGLDPDSDKDIDDIEDSQEENATTIRRQARPIWGRPGPRRPANPNPQSVLPVGARLYQSKSLTGMNTSMPPPPRLASYQTGTSTGQSAGSANPASAFTMPLHSRRTGSTSSGTTAGSRSGSPKAISRSPSGARLSGSPSVPHTIGTKPMSQMTTIGTTGGISRSQKSVSPILSSASSIIVPSKSDTMGMKQMSQVQSRNDAEELEDSSGLEGLDDNDLMDSLGANKLMEQIFAESQIDLQDEDAQVDDVDMIDLTEVQSQKFNQQLAQQSAQHSSQQSTQQDAQDPSQEPPKSTYDRHSRNLISALEEGEDCLVRTALSLKGMPCDKWVRKRLEVGKIVRESLIFSLWVMTLSWDPLILKHFVKGDLPSAQRNNPDLRKALTKLKSSPGAIPCTYAQYLVHKKTGMSPTAGIWKSILEDVKLYTNRLFTGQPDKDSDAFAEKVDRIMFGNKVVKGAAGKGVSLYLEKTSRVFMCDTWISETERRLIGLPDDKPLERPVCEVGYASNPMTRLAQHASHTSSNYLMNLVDAICKLKYSDYIMDQYVVHHIFHHTHAMFDEIMAHRYALAYVHFGGGYSHAAAGMSHAGANTVDADHYKLMQKKLENDQRFQDRITEGLKKIHARAAFYEEYVDTIKKEKALIESLKSKSEELIRKCDEQTKVEEQMWEEFDQETRDLMEYLAD